MFLPISVLLTLIFYTYITPGSVNYETYLNQLNEA